MPSASQPPTPASGCRKGAPADAVEANGSTVKADERSRLSARARGRLLMRRRSLPPRVRSLFVHCCHCLNCQRQTGSAFVINLLIETDRVELLAGNPVPIDVPRGAKTTQRIFRCRPATSRSSAATREQARGSSAAERSTTIAHLAGRAHLHANETALGDASDSVPAFSTRLRPAEALAAREPRAHRGAQKAAYPAASAGTHWRRDSRTCDLRRDRTATGTSDKSQGLRNCQARAGRGYTFSLRTTAARRA